MNAAKMGFASVFGGCLALNLWALIWGVLLQDEPYSLASMGHPVIILAVFAFGCFAGAVIGANLSKSSKSRIYM